MPLPLLMIPAATVVITSSASIGPIITAIVAAVTGATGLGVGGIYLYLSKKEPEFMDVVKEVRTEQEKITTERIVATQEIIQSLHPKLTELAQSVKESKDASEDSANNLKQATTVLKEVSSDLDNNIQLIKGVEARFADSLKNTAQELGAQTQKICSKQDEFNELLQQSEAKQRIIHDEMNVLKSALEIQSTTSSELNRIIKTLQDVNAELQNKLNALEPQNKLLAEHSRFFKQAVLSSSLLADASKPTNSSLN